MTKYNVTGMSCAACSARVKKAVSALPEVTECSVNLLTNSMTVEGSTPETVIAAVTAAGYGASVADGNKKTQTSAFKKDTDTLAARFVCSLVLLAVLMYFSMGHTMWGWWLPNALVENPLAQGLIQLLLTIAVMVINGRFFVSGFKALWHRAPNMDCLVALGSGAAFVYSVAVFFQMTQSAMAGDRAAVRHGLHDFYFESAAMILTLITVGKMLESRSKGKTTDALRRLMDLTPKTAVILTDAGEQAVPVEMVQKGSVFVVRPGESVPVDGEIIEGETSVDESALTGESIPVDKKIGQSVSAATINLSGFVKCRATRVGEDTTLSQIIKMVSDASASKAPIAKIADTVSGVFVPIVMGIALLATVIWLIINGEIGYALARGISVLVISCPCALGLATPVAIMVGSGVGAKNGILFKTATAIEQTGKVCQIALDKTGTVTLGKPEVTDILPLGTDEKTLLELAYALEYRSEHPLAGAVVRYAQKKGTTLSDVSEFEIVAGSGLKGKLNGKWVFGGNVGFIGQYTTLEQTVMDKAEKLAGEGKTPLYFVQEDCLLGMIAVADVIKKDSKSAIETLKKLGIRVIMLTGDNEKTARAIAKTAGIDEVVAEVMPAGKRDVIASLCKEGKTAMVGDGINDAPALTAADIGIAIGAGADVALDAADVVLMRGSLWDAVNAITLSRATLRNIKENLFWAFVYNCIGIPLAAGVFVSLLGWELEPMFGAAAMSLSSFCVVSNALRLNFFKPKQQRKENKSMEIVLKVEGMMCPHCEAHVKSALEALPGVIEATASHTDKRVVVTAAETVSPSLIKQTVTAQGYTVVE